MGHRRLRRGSPPVRTLLAMDAAMSAAERQRRDVITRLAVRRPGSRQPWMCRQLNGKVKPSYPSEAVARHAAELLAVLGEAGRQRAYQCRMEYSRSVIGDHWHLTVDTHGEDR